MDSQSRYLAHQWILGQRSRLGLGDRVAGVSYAPLSSAPLVVYSVILTLELEHSQIHTHNTLTHQNTGSQGGMSKV